MAGGMYAEVVPCIWCAGESRRTHEGQENDSYNCLECGKSFMIDWSYDGPPRSPRWPISAEEAERRRKDAEKYFAILPPR